MKPLICIAIAMASVCNTSFAGPGTPSKVSFPETFTAVLKESRHLYEPDVARLCSCQVLQVASSNQKETFIAVFAEAVNTGDAAVHFASTAIVLEREKKHLKAFFFTKIKTAETLTATTQCSMLYKNILAKYDGVKMYDVLDADALNNKQVYQK